jgi:hypothetical protein
VREAAEGGGVVVNQEDASALQRTRQSVTLPVISMRAVPL